MAKWWNTHDIFTMYFLSFYNDNEVDMPIWKIYWKNSRNIMIIILPYCKMLLRLRLYMNVHKNSRIASCINGCTFLKLFESDYNISVNLQWCQMNDETRGQKQYE
jgi:hypothetical protein